jgi:hypothetical protein
MEESLSPTGRDGQAIGPPGESVGTTSFFVGTNVTMDERQALPLATMSIDVRMRDSHEVIPDLLTLGDLRQSEGLQRLR